MVALEEVRKDPHDYQALYTQASGEARRRRTCSRICSHCDQSNYMPGSINKGTEIEKQRDDGLVERHAYSIIRVARITSVPGFIGLVQCRCPVGQQLRVEW